MGNAVSRLRDRLLLVFTALVCGGLILLSIALIGPRFSREWAKFIYSSIAYLVVLISTGFTFEPFRRLPRIKLLLFQVIFYVLTVGVAFLIFNFDLLPLPTGGLAYVLPMMVLSVVSLIVLDYLRKRFNFFKK